MDYVKCISVVHLHEVGQARLDMVLLSMLQQIHCKIEYRKIVHSET